MIPVAELVTQSGILTITVKFSSAGSDIFSTRKYIN